MAGLEGSMHRGRATVLILATGITVLLVLTSSVTAVPAPGASGGSSGWSTDAVPAGRSVVTVAPAYAARGGVAALGPLGANVSVSVDVGLVSRDPAGLAAFVQASEVPGTPAYRTFLGAAQAAARFGALPSAVASAESYFEGFGLATSANPDGLLVSVSGPASEVGRAFDTTFERYRAPSGAVFFSHPAPASLPPVAPWSGVYGLGNATAFTPDLEGPLAYALPAAGGSCPSDATGLTPCDVATAYDFAGLEANGTNGSGERIAVIDPYSSKAKQPALANDYAAFSSEFGLPSSGLSFVYPVRTTANLNATGTNPIWHVEDVLDIEWTHAAAPGASVEMVFAPNGGAGLYYAIDWVVAEKAADVISMSWGEPEVGVFNGSYQPCSASCNASSDGSLELLGPVLELAAAEGISSFAASGDCGAAGGTNGVSVSYPASSPYVTGVGGTRLAIDAGGAYRGEAGWSGNSSGSPYPGCTNGGGSGGGFSVLPRPVWQTGPGTVASRGRGVPDVALDAATPGVVAIAGGFAGYGGTSLATPIWAGITAIADQHAGSDLGLLDPGLYTILAGTSYADDFHDITTGNNGYSAGVGWDALTGVGTPIVAPLVADLARGAVSAPGPATSVYASPRFGPAPLSVTFVVRASGGSGSYPIEGVAFGDGTAAPVAGSRATHTFVAPGAYSVQSYVVDSTGATSASPPIVVVVGGGGPLTVSLNASTTSPAVGADVLFTADATGGTPPYLYNFSLGDGVLVVNQTSPTLSRPYGAVGGFCAEVVVRDSARPEDGGASARVPIAVGGAAAPACGNPAQPLKLTGAVPGVRDAPADFPHLFTSTGGVSAPGGLAAQVDLASRDRYTAACACTILRIPGDYTVQEWENDTVNGEAHASTNVTVAPELNATFSATTLAGPAPLSVTFTVTASGGYFASAADAHWSFGNGDHRPGAVVTESYTTPGQYVAIGSLSDAGHGNASEAFVLDVERPGANAVGVTATVTPAVNVSSGTTVDWNATEIGPASALQGSFVRWGLGNGAVAYGRTANETYYASVDGLTGDLLPATVSLETAYVRPLVTVAVPLPGFFATEAGGFVPAADALVLATSLSPLSGVVPLKIVGSATASGPGGAGVGWLFGDSGSASGLSVTHVYYGAAAYTVAAKAFDGFNDRGQRLEGVLVNLTLTLAGCGTATIHGTAPYTLHLGPVPVGGAGPPYTYLWTLPNGSTSAATNVTVAFSSGGTYTVDVVVSDSASATTGCSWTVVVGSRPAILPLEVVGAGLAAGVALAGVFLYATRPRRD